MSSKVEGSSTSAFYGGLHSFTLCTPALFYYCHFSLFANQLLSFLMLLSTSILTWILPLGYFLHEPQASMWQLSFIVYVPCITQVSVWIIPNGFSYDNLVSASLVSKLIAENISYILKMLPYSTQCLVTTQVIASNYFKPTSTKFSPQHSIY